jgi:DNA repair exonuclease SbcCD ATPase subunit
MIQILRLRIEEFRGIRKLDLDLKGKPFVVHGPNGSGKSGVVDAIGFALTGTIARLTGTGTGGLSVQKHGPHVHRRDDPGAAKVALTFRDPASGKTGTIERTVKNPGSFKLTPETPALRAVLDRVERHPELTPSRREIIKFILAEAGKRAVEVQALLQLDTLDAQRKALRTAVSKVFCLGRHQRQTICQQPYLDVEAVEATVDQFWQTVRLPAGVKDSIEEGLRIELDAQHERAEPEIHRARERVQQLADQRRRLARESSPVPYPTTSPARSKSASSATSTMPNASSRHQR